MTKAKAKSKSKTKAKSKSPKKSALQASAKPAGDHARLLPDKKLVIDLSKDFDRAANRNGQTRIDLKESIDDAKEHGIDVQAFRTAKKLIKQADDNPIGAAIRWENMQYYLEVLGFDKMIAPSMFKAKETHSSKKSSAKTNGKTDHRHSQQEALLKASAEMQQAAQQQKTEERPEDAPVH